MGAFSANHQRYLLTRIRHIDEILGDAVQALAPTDEGRLFKRIVPDATQGQRKILSDYLAQLRFALRRFVDAQELDDGLRPVSGLWSLRTALMFAQTAVVELRPDYMRGYGELDSEAIAASERLVPELTSLLKRIIDYLDKGDQGDLASRVAHLDGTREEFSLLRELERVIRTHGLIELRARLESLIARATAPRYEIAVFGRVNSGKSSLLNWWLGEAVLPTGVVPVTAVPTRIRYGNVPKVRVREASLPPKDVPLSELPHYVTEAGNPGNARRVLEIIVEMPSDRLSGDVVLVDAPGLGSLATAGAGQTLDYLPQCDLGIQLIEAGGSLTREDLLVTRALLDGGSDVTIVLSKADRVSGTELAQAEAYVRNMVNTELGVALSVWAVSTLPTHATLAAQWLADELSPKLANSRQQAAALLRRKIGALRETVTAVLATRLVPGLDPGPPGAAIRSAPQQAAQLRADLDRTRAEFLARVDRVGDCTEWLVEGASGELLRSWLEPPLAVASAAERVSGGIAHHAADIGDVIAEGLSGACNKLRDSLAAEATEQLSMPRGRPIYDVAAIPKLASYARPLWALKLRPLLRKAAQQRVDAQLGSALREQLTVYAAALRFWGVRYLEELGKVFEDALAVHASLDRLSAETPVTPGTTQSMAEDLQTLQQWSERSEMRS